jgi:hypothetical protein
MKEMFRCIFHAKTNTVTRNFFFILGIINYLSDNIFLKEITIFIYIY